MSVLLDFFYRSASFTSVVIAYTVTQIIAFLKKKKDQWKHIFVVINIMLQMLLIEA